MTDTPSCTHSELPDLIRRHLQDDEFLWFPGLASSLTGSLGGACECDAQQYSTGAWLGDAEVPPRLLGPSDELHLGGRPVKVEQLSADHRSLFPDLTFWSGQETPTLLHRSVDVINSVPTLAASAGHVVRSVHLLTAPRSYDVSRSIPSLPFSIFVSVPEADEAHGILRLAESIVHESMHLQLSLIERCLPIVEAGADEHGMSPWQMRERPIAGLLHGLYVFAVITQFMAVLGTATPDSGTYLRDRHRQILDEVASLPLCPASLTPAGRRLWLRALDAVQGRN